MQTTSRTLRTVFRTLLCSALVLTTSSLIPQAQADGPADNVATKVRPIPPVGIPIPDDLQKELLDGAKLIDESVIRHYSSASPADAAEVLVISRALRMTIADKMFYSDKDFAPAKALLTLGLERAKALAAGDRGAKLIGLSDAPSEKPQLLAGGFRSKLDNSIQPYGLVVPAGVDFKQKQPLRLDVWLHGRGENVSEVAFLNQRLKQAGEVTPPNTIVLHPYGRYCNAFKFAGEIDVLEAIEHVKTLFNIDNDRIVIRGFSMGGAGCWQMAVHYPGMWMAATPGAGFSETTEFLRVFQQEEFKPTPYQKSLLHWYDCPDWANNLRYLPTVAYSGEIDKQKQAADMMEAAFTARGMKLNHIIGPQTAHKLHPDSKVEVEKFIADAAAKGRDRVPKKIDFTTYSLRYAQHTWLTVEGLGEHWQEARVQAEIADGNRLSLKTQNVTKLSIHLPHKESNLDLSQAVECSIDDQSIRVRSELGKDFRFTFAKQNDKWSAVSSTQDSKLLVKRPGLQGPIDDAFMSAFLFVGPTVTDKAAGKSTAATDWIAKEYQHALNEWRRQFRGDIVERLAGDVSKDDLQNKNLVLFGTPETNPLIKQITQSLPVRWEGSEVVAGSTRVPADSHVPLLIYPNPLNPERYVVINSGFSYREFAYLNNARQVPMLPDWAVVDVSKGSNYQMPGDVKAAGFFDEQWKLK